MDLGITGRACVVTGAGRGIGRATARMLCEAGGQVLLVARTESEVRDAAGECGRAGAPSNGRAAHLAIDVTEATAGERILAEAEDRFGSLDVIVNCAGTARWRDLDELTDDDWYAAWEINVMAPMRLLRAALPAMAERGWGRVVNVSSTAGKRPSQQLSEYSVAKAAQLSLSRLFADRFAGSGVLVNAVTPGLVKSELWMSPGGMLDQMVEAQGGGDRDSALAEFGSSRPVGRFAEVEEIAAPIVFLCSEHASYVAGAAWSVDGGAVQVII
jgi:NAD(P)-dependent dehydrogenase (short-subunit alcohol dehydrogenase family)